MALTALALTDSFRPGAMARLVSFFQGRTAKAANTEALQRLEIARLQAALVESQARLDKATAEAADLRHQLDHDPLTGVRNRRGLEAAFHAHGTGTVMAVLDIDHFKKINDTHGHAVGDRVLKDFTRLMRARLAGDLPIYRVGGEEFVIYFPACDLKSVAARLDRFRVDLKDDRFARTADGVEVSFSAGLALRTRTGQGFSATFKRADERLYAAKMAGRAKTVYRDADGQGALAAAG